MGGHAPHGQNDASDTRFVACPGKAEERNEAERPPALQAPPGRTNGGYGAGAPPQTPARPPAHERHGPAPRGAAPTGRADQGDREGPAHPHAHAHSTWIADPKSRPVGGQSGEGERLTPDAPRNSGRHPPQGPLSATPTTPSQVGGNRDRTAPPQARQTEQGTGAGHAEGHGPRGTALPGPSAATAQGAQATPPGGNSGVGGTPLLFGV